MNKAIAQQLNEVAAGMPILFKWGIAPELFTGEELNLTPLGEFQKFEPGVMYSVDMPALYANENKQQLKDAYKRGGLAEVQRYHRQHMAAVNACSPGTMKYYTKEHGLTDTKIN